MTRLVYDWTEGIDWDEQIHARTQLHTHPYVETPDELVDHYDNDANQTVHAVQVATQQDIWPWTEWNSINNNWEDRYPIGHHDETDDENKRVDLVAIDGAECSAMLHQRLDTMSKRAHHIHLDFDTPYLDEYDDGDDNTFEEFFASTEETDAVHTFAHPGRYSRPGDFKRYTNSYQEFDHVVGIEVRTQTNQMYPTDEILLPSLWDRLLSYLMPDTQVFATSVDDTHAIEGREGVEFDVGYCMMLVDELTQSSIRNAMLNGRFYWEHHPGIDTAAPELHSIDVDKDLREITINASGYDEIEWISHGEVVDRGETFDYDGRDINYVRARINEYEDGDPDDWENVRTTGTQPWGFQPEFDIARFDGGKVILAGQIREANNKMRFSRHGDLDLNQINEMSDKTQFDGTDLETSDEIKETR